LDEAATNGPNVKFATHLVEISSTRQLQIMLKQEVDILLMGGTAEYFPRFSIRSAEERANIRDQNGIAARGIKRRK
jgi:predicted metallo-beta-lactamase superfamily hydrolase